MKRASYSLALTLFLLNMLYFPLAAQEVASCAASRLQASPRLAIATPQHVKRMNQYDITFYGLDLHLERNSTYIFGTVTLEAKLNQAQLDTFAFELHPDFQIESIQINGVAQPNINRNGSDVSVKLASAILNTDKVTAAITYSGTAPRSEAAAIGSGFNTAYEPAFDRNVTWSLSEPYAAYEWWPTKQVLTDKADSVHVFVTTSADNKVGSNGVLTRVVNLPDGKRRHEWKSNYPIAYYLVSVAVSNYEEYLIYANPAGATAPIPILNYLYSPEALAMFKPEIDRTAPFLEYYSSLFTLYPFAKEKYGHSMARIGGGMEHQTMTTQVTFTFTLTAHELAHQWFGNNVTCASWRDIWLNEGFASYAEYLALQQFKPEEAADWMSDAHEFVLGELDGSVLVPDTTDVSRIFNYRLTYKKAAAVVHMLRYEVNDDALFFKALQNYQQQFANRTATTADLQQVFEQTTGLEMDYFFEQWVAGSGYPAFAVTWNQKGQNILLVSRQAPTSSTSFFKTAIEYRIQTASLDTTIRVPHDAPVQQYLFTLAKDEPVSSVTIDPDNWVLNHTTLVKQDKNLIVPDVLKDTPVLFPNPANTSLKITKLSFAATSATLYDRLGRQMWQQQLHGSKEVEVDVQQLKSGLYIVHLSDGKNHHRLPFIKIE